MDMVGKTLVLKQIIILMPADFPSHRELQIQSAKLLRLIDKRPDIDPDHTLGEGSLKKFHKVRGQHDAACARQARILDSMIEKSFREWLRKEWEKDGKPYSKKAFQEWKTSFNKGLTEGIATMKKLAADRNKMKKLAAKAT